MTVSRPFSICQQSSSYHTGSSLNPSTYEPSKDMEARANEEKILKYIHIYFKIIGLLLVTTYQNFQLVLIKTWPSSAHNLLCEYFLNQRWRSR